MHLSNTKLVWSYLISQKLRKTSADNGSLTSSGAGNSDLSIRDRTSWRLWVAAQQLCRAASEGPSGHKLSWASHLPWHWERPTTPWVVLARALPAGQGRSLFFVQAFLRDIWGNCTHFWAPWGMRSHPSGVTLVGVMAKGRAYGLCGDVKEIGFV